MNWKQYALAIVVIFLIVGAVTYFWRPESGVHSKTALSDVYDYLDEARHIKISKMNFDNASRTVKSVVLLNSSEPHDIDSFLQVLKAQTNPENATTSFKSMKVFTPDYRVELTCKAPAVIEFIFYEDANAACLRNKDCFFFAKFTPENVEALKTYFTHER